MPPGREAEARRFYGEMLGLREIVKPPRLAARGGAWFENAHVKLHLGVEEDFRAARRAHPGLLVADLREFVIRMRDAGYDVVEDEPIEDTGRAYATDPFGNRLELIQAPAKQ